MTTKSEATKRDFISQMIELALSEKENLLASGFTVDGKITSLQNNKQLTDEAEMKQQESQAIAMAATKNANKLLNDTYKEASNLADAISGLLGRDNEIVKKMRKFRK